MSVDNNYVYHCTAEYISPCDGVREYVDGIYQTVDKILDNGAKNAMLDYVTRDEHPNKRSNFVIINLAYLGREKDNE